MAFKYGLRRCEEPKQDGIFQSIWQYRLEGDYKIHECIIEIYVRRPKYKAIYSSSMVNLSTIHTTLLPVKLCKEPKPIRNGEVECLASRRGEKNQYEEGTRCLYRCNKNYKLSRLKKVKHLDFIECKIDDKNNDRLGWSNELDSNEAGCVQVEDFPVCFQNCNANEIVNKSILQGFTISEREFFNKIPKFKNRQNRTLSTRCNPLLPKEFHNNQFLPYYYRCFAEDDKIQSKSIDYWITLYIYPIICPNPKSSLITKEHGINPVVKCESLWDINKGNAKLNHYPLRRHRQCTETCSKQYHVSSFRHTRIVHICTDYGKWRPKFKNVFYCMIGCPKGHFFDKAQLECKKCKKNYFQSEDEKGYCTPCPKYFQTEYEGSTTCTPGYDMLKEIMRGLEDDATARLASIRCMKKCIKNIRDGQPYPASMCHVPKYYKYKIGLLEQSQIKVYDAPEGQEIDTLRCSSTSVLYIDGDEVYTSSGIYGKLIKFKLSSTGTIAEIDGFVQIVSVDKDTKATESNLHMVVKDELSPTLKNVCLFFKCKHYSWQKAVENEFSCGSPKVNNMIESHEEATTALEKYPDGWTYDHDIELLKFLSDPEVLKYCGHAETTRKSIKNIDVSSYSDSYSDKDHLIDDNPETFWESDDSSTHWIRLTMEYNVIIKSLSVMVAEGDDNYFPKRICVKVGPSLEKLQEVRETKLNYTSTVGVREVTILGEQLEFHPIIQIEIKECMEDGIDTRIRGIKVRIEKKRSQELAVYTFKDIMEVKFPRLIDFDLAILRRRVLLLTRLVALFESVAKFLIPNWNNKPTEPCKLIQLMKPFYSLSVKRLDIVEELLHLSEYDNSNGECPSLHINRLSKTEHRADPRADPECRKTVFVQVYDGLLKADLENFDYRWGSNSRSQWWECKFTQEGIIDQGGGFRDSLSDIAEELCPPADSPDLLPLFVRAPNQRNASMNIYKDAFVPSPSCTWFKRYEWLGKLMGACFRSKENLVLNLSPFVWKKLCGEPVSWNDFATVDDSDVKVLNSIESMSEEEFQAFFGGEVYWTAIFSDGSEVELSLDGSHTPVTYEERIDYCNAVKRVRMAESDKQIDAIRRGLLSVVPQSALDLLNWEEAERRVCGAAEITMDSLKSSTHFEELMENDSRTKYMWMALENFNDDERSRFLRFVTGRKRLPAPVYICSLKNGNEEDIDSLPESSTCSNTLYLPKYSSSSKCEEKLRYAIYNCLAIDADMMPYDME